VAKLHNIYRPSGVQKLWTFEHPLKPDESFERKGECLFVVEQNTLIHGFAGYFDCDLYENCRLSTNPE
jgi:protein arginine N-methyltransferase 5